MPNSKPLFQNIIDAAAPKYLFTDTAMRAQGSYLVVLNKLALKEKGPITPDLHCPDNQIDTISLIIN